MRRNVIIAGLAFAATLLAEGWNGTLVDANCKDAKPSAACPISEATSRFGFVRSGGVGRKYFKFADEDNTRVASVLANRQKETGKFPAGNLKVWLTGKPRGNRLALKDIEFR